MSKQSEALAVVRRYSCTFTSDLHKKAKKWHDGYVQVHHLNKKIVLMDSGLRPMDETFVPHSVTKTPSLDVGFFLPDGFELDLGAYKCCVEQLESESIADLTELKTVKADAKKRVREWAAEEDAKTPGSGSKRHRDNSFVSHTTSPSVKKPYSPLMSRAQTTAYKPSPLNRASTSSSTHKPSTASYSKQGAEDCESVNDLSWLDDVSDDEGKSVSPYVQAAPSARLQALLKGKDPNSPSGSAKPFKPLKAKNGFKPPSLQQKVVSRSKREGEKSEDDEADKQALIRSRLKVNWSALG